MEKLAQWLERDYPEAARSLREGLAETFTINRLDVPPGLHRCLATTNLMESPQSGVRQRTRKITRWRDGEMVLRWVAGAYQITEGNFRKIMGYEQLWTLAAILGRRNETIGYKQDERFFSPWVLVLWLRETVGRSKLGSMSTMEEIQDATQRLSAEERLKLLEVLWESLAATPEAIPLTEAQRQELDRRLDDLDREGPTGMPWEEVLRRIREREQ